MWCSLSLSSLFPFLSFLLQLSHFCPGPASSGLKREKTPTVTTSHGFYTGYAKRNSRLCIDLAMKMIVPCRL